MNKENSIGFIPDRFEYYEVEAEKIIRWLKTDPEFCHDFFFGNNPKMCNIAQLRSVVFQAVCPKSVDFRDAVQS